MKKIDKRVEELLKTFKERGIILTEKEEMIFGNGFRLGVTEGIKIHTDTINEYFDKDMEE